MSDTLKVIKIGGEIIDDDSKLDEALKTFTSIKGNKILVHGGGKLATEISQKLGIKTQMHDGRRITTQEDLEVVTMVYAGLINKKIVAKLQALNCNAIGLTGADANSIVCSKRTVKDIDYGFAGDIEYIRHQNIERLLKMDFTPVFCAITHDKKGQLLNTNADTIASEVAIAMSKIHQTRLVFCFDKKGVLLDMENPDSVIEHIDKNHYTKLINDKIINAGMLPKLKKGFDALEQNVSKVIIGDINAINNESTLFTSLKL